MRALRWMLLLGLLALMAVVPAGAANSVTFQDSTGEDPAGPDITTVVVSNDDKAALSFRVNIPNLPQLTRDILVDLFVDSDKTRPPVIPTLSGAITSFSSSSGRSRSSSGMAQTSPGAGRSAGDHPQLLWEGGVRSASPRPSSATARQ